MSRTIDSVRIPVVANVAANGTGLISTENVKPNQALVVQSVAWKNATGARGTATLRIKSGPVDYPLGDQPSPDADSWYYYPFEQHLKEGEQVEVAQADCIAADVLHLMVIGYIEFLEVK